MSADEKLVAPVGDPEPAAKKDTSPPMTAEQVVTETGGTLKDATSYVLLQLDDKGGWQVVNKAAEGRSAEAAIRARVEANKPQLAVTLVAVPARSWRPVTVTPKTTTTLVIEEAT